MDKSNKVKILSCIISIGFVVAIFFHYFLGTYFHLKVPYNTFISVPNLQPFGDFMNITDYLKNFAPFTFPNMWINYFPLAYILLFPFALIKSKFVSYLIFFSIFLLFWVFINIKTLYCKNLNKLENFQNIFFITFLSYPFLILWDSGNFDMMLFLFTAAFIYFFKSKKYFTSALFIAFANAIKPFTWIFLILFLFDKKYKELIFSITLSTLMIIGGFMVLRGGLLTQIQVYLINLKLTQSYFILSPTGGLGGNSSSLFMSLKALNALFYAKYHFALNPQALVNICRNLGLTLTSIILFFSWKEKVFWKKVALLTFYMLTFSFIVYDYKLILLFIPLWLFINEEEQTKFDLSYLILFSLLLIPKRFIVMWPKIFIFSSIFNPFIMLIFIGLIIFEQFYLKYKAK